MGIFDFAKGQLRQDHQLKRRLNRRNFLPFSCQSSETPWSRFFGWMDCWRYQINLVLAYRHSSDRTRLQMRMPMTGKRLSSTSRFPLGRWSVVNTLGCSFYFLMKGFNFEIGAKHPRSFWRAFFLVALRAIIACLSTSNECVHEIVGNAFQSMWRVRIALLAGGRLDNSRPPLVSLK